ncbi:MAG: molybdopterin-dependent oxidoreductase [Chloroflexota bacterium]
MTTKGSLPPGQYEISEFPRFGLWKYANRFRQTFAPLNVVISGDVQQSITITQQDLATLPRIEQTSDFHCVTTWTKTGLTWSGVRFHDFYEQIAQPQAVPSKATTIVIFRAQDGYRASLPIEDLLAQDILLVDTFEGIPISAEHGAPLRLLAPAHYGYKSVKHLKAIEFWEADSKFIPPGFRFMGHPRGRVHLEERSESMIPNWLLRLLYRPLIQPTIRRFEQGMRKER